MVIKAHVKLALVDLLNLCNLWIAVSLLKPEGKTAAEESWRPYVRAAKH